MLKKIITHSNIQFAVWVLLLATGSYLLISQPKLTMPQIAEMAGFSSCFHFTTLFTDKEGLTPAKWREKNTGI